MPKQTLNILKSWFKTGLKPTQAQFWDLMDSFFHKDEKIPISSIDGVQTEFDKYASKDELRLKENIGVAASLIQSLIGGATINGDTLKKLEERIKVAEALIGEEAGDDDSFVTNLREVLTILENYPEGTNILSLIANKPVVCDHTIEGQGIENNVLSVRNQLSYYDSTVAGGAINLYSNREMVIKTPLPATVSIALATPMSDTIRTEYSLWFTCTALPTITMPIYDLGLCKVNSGTLLQVDAFATGTSINGANPKDYRLFLKQGQTVFINGQSRIVNTVSATSFTVTVAMGAAIGAGNLSASARWMGSTTPSITINNMNNWIFTAVWMDDWYYVITASKGEY